MAKSKFTTRVHIRDLEAGKPIVIDGIPVTLERAQRLKDQLADAIKSVVDHFRCGDISNLGHQCYARGCAKIDGRWYCLRHSGKAARGSSFARELREADRRASGKGD